MNVSQEPLVRLDGVSKVFRLGERETAALTDVRLEIDAGDYVAVTGPSGSGKSTLLAVIGLLEAPSAGRLSLRGRSLTALSAAERARVRGREFGFVFQDVYLLPHLSVLGNVELPLQYQDVSQAERRCRAVEALERVHMGSRAWQRPEQLTGAQRQRVALARALVGRPPLVLADEPAGRLDSRSGERLLDLLDELHAQGTAVCLASHDPRCARRADHVVQLLDGRVVRETYCGVGLEPAGTA